ncbi:DUF1707 SHOCT-like domain-containing protein [Leifsonia sp. AG29]|uniref:DUF1707 SHOCT-like domain-containing protein n=1 Tax=Leifsonia sp. AG29 TaxID=2598860 RepID=UPI00131EAA74|nr:DUF1707 domain-containing protein [Leifsonia sp. AG29]
MTDVNDPSGALRLSNDERERAVAALRAQADQGRLSPAELDARSASARSATTRGDLTPLFADLPVRPDFDRHDAAPGSGTGAPYPPQPGYSQPGYSRPGTGWGEPARSSNRTSLILVSIMPFVSLILFFITGYVWGFQYSWLWFLLIPLVGAISYGVDGGRRR